MGAAQRLGSTRHDQRRPGLRSLDLGTLVQLHALGQEPIPHHRHQLRVVVGQNRALIDQDDLGAQPAERLGELAADRPASQHQEPRWQHGQIEDRLVGQVIQCSQPGQLGHRRPAAGRDHEPPGADPVRACLHKARADEPRLFPQDGDAQPLKSLDAILRRNARDDAADVPAHRQEVDLRARRS